MNPTRPYAGDAALSATLTRLGEEADYAESALLEGALARSVGGRGTRRRPGAALLVAAAAVSVGAIALGATLLLGPGDTGGSGTTGLTPAATTTASSAIRSTSPTTTPTTTPTSSASVPVDPSPVRFLGQLQGTWRVDGAADQLRISNATAQRADWAAGGADCDVRLGELTLDGGPVTFTTTTVYDSLCQAPDQLGPTLDATASVVLRDPTTMLLLADDGSTLATLTRLAP